MRLTKGAAAGATLLWFLACYFSTAPDYIADTLRFVVDAIEHAKGKQGQFWEFGHILWRRWAYVGYSLLGAWYAQWFGDSPVQAVARFLIQTNFICSAVALQLMLLILRGFVSAWIALASVFAMTCAYPFLNFCHSGAPYIPALSCAMLTLYLVIRATENPEKGGQFAFMASISFTLACGLWFTYAFSGLGMVAALWLMNTNNSGESSASLVGRRDLVLLFLGSLTFAAFLLFAAGAAAHGIRNGSRLFQWIKESDNGW